MTIPFQIALIQNGVWTYDPLTPQPNGSQHTPPALLSVSGAGLATVSGYAYQIWTWQILPMDKWYYLFSLWRQSRLARGHVRIQWPDPQSGALTTASARFDMPTQQGRDVAVARGISATFSHLGIDDSAVVGTWRAPVF